MPKLDEWEADVTLPVRPVNTVASLDLLLTNEWNREHDWLLSGQKPWWVFPQTVIDQGPVKFQKSQLRKTHSLKRLLHLVSVDSSACYQLRRIIQRGIQELQVGLLASNRWAVPDSAINNTFEVSVWTSVPQAAEGDERWVHGSTNDGLL